MPANHPATPTYVKGRPDAPMLAAWARSGFLAFGVPPDKARAYLAAATDDQLRAVTRDGSLAATMLRYPMGQWWGGRRVPMDGVAWVTVPPETRGSGVATFLMTSWAREAREAGFALGSLYSAKQRLYRRVGFEQAGLSCRITLRLRELTTRDRAGADDGCTFRAVREGEDGTLLDLRRRFAATRPGYLDPHPQLWSRLRGAFDPERPTDAVLIERAGEPVGYLLAQPGESRGPGRGSDLLVRDAAAVDGPAWRAILRYLAGFATTFESASLFAGPDHPLTMLCDEPALRTEVLDRWMLRVLDVERAIAGRGFPPAVAGEVSLDVDDPTLPENAGRWTIRVEGGRGEATRAGDGAVRLSVNALASIYAGYQSPAQLASLAMVTGDDGSLALLGAMFAGPTPSMQIRF